MKAKASKATKRPAMGPKARTLLALIEEGTTPAELMGAIQAVMRAAGGQEVTRAESRVLQSAMDTKQRSYRRYVRRLEQLVRAGETTEAEQHIARGPFHMSAPGKKPARA